MRRKPGAPPRNGTELQMDLLRYAKEHGWRVQMSRRSQLCRTESTPGFPDLVLAKPGKMAFIETKSRYERLAPDQEEWARAIVGHYSGQVSSKVSYLQDGFRLSLVWAVFRPQQVEEAKALIREDAGTWV